MDHAALRASDNETRAGSVSPISAKQAIAVGRTTIRIEVEADEVRASLIRTDSLEVLSQSAFDRANRLPAALASGPFDHVWWATVNVVDGLGTQVKNQFGLRPYRIQSIDISSSELSVFAFDAEGRLLTFDDPQQPRTEAAAELSALFGTHIAEDSFIAQLHQAVHDDDPHAAQVATVMTLAGILYYRLTGETLVSSNEAAHLFPVSDAVGDYDQSMAEAYDSLAGTRLSAPIRSLLPAIVSPGVGAGSLILDAANELIVEGGLRPESSVRFG